MIGIPMRDIAPQAQKNISQLKTCELLEVAASNSLSPVIERMNIGAHPNKYASLPD